MPKISVIMSTYNGKKFIRRSVNSLLNQTYRDFEIIICDDGSTDGTLEILNQYDELHSNIKVIQNEQNLGLPGSLNRCIQIAKGEYLARMDDDDVSYPKRFEKEVEFLENNPEYTVVGTSRYFFDEEGIWGESINHGERTMIDIFTGNIFAHPTVMMRKDDVTSVGGYSEEKWIGRAEDYDLWCKLYQHGFKGFNLKEVLLDYYESKNSYKKRKIKYRFNEFRVRKYWRKKLNLPYYYDVYSYKQLLGAFIPTILYSFLQRKRFSKSDVII